jgi:Superinfection immunity protein
LPSIVAGQRGKAEGQEVILFVNLFFGWTVLGWLACLIWAAAGRTKADIKCEEKHHQELLAAMAARRQS